MAKAEAEVQGVGSGKNGGGSHLRKLECCRRPPAQCWDDSTIPPCFVSFLVFLQLMSLWLAAACWSPGKTSFSQWAREYPGQGWLRDGGFGL